MVPRKVEIFKVFGTLWQQWIKMEEEKEVAEILTYPLQMVLDDANVHKVEVALAGGLKIKSPAFVFGREKIWGATAMVLAELKVMLA